MHTLVNWNVSELFRRRFLAAIEPGLLANPQA